MSDSTRSGSTTVLSNNLFEKWVSRRPVYTRYYCPMCMSRSEIVYRNMKMCLREDCAMYFKNPDTRENIKVPIIDTPPSAWDYERIKPDTLGLHLRPPKRPSKLNIEVPRDQSGREYWRSWICDRCGMANERRYWREANCEACHLSSSPEGQSRVYEEAQLRPPLRPVATGPRQEDGSPNWPNAISVSRSWTLYDDDIKVVQHDISGLSTSGSLLHHALSTRSHGCHIPGEKILKEIQMQASGKIPLKRHTITTPRRQAERYLSPFFTFLCGPESTTPIDVFPASSPEFWSNCPPICTDAIDLINERAGRMSHGPKEKFNSLLIAAIPPQLLTAHLPRVVVEPYSEYAILVLGPDALIKLRSALTRSASGEITMQSGDVVVVKSTEDPIELTIKLDTFGFVFIGRQSYRVSSAELEEQMSTKVIESVPMKTSDSGSSAKVVKTSSDVVPLIPPTPQVVVPATKLPVAPISEWYLGPIPLDPNQPIRALPSRRKDLGIPFPEGYTHSNGETVNPPPSDPVGGETQELPAQARITLSSSPPPPTILAPVPLSANMKKRFLAGPEEDEVDVAKEVNVQPKTKQKEARRSSTTKAEVESVTSSVSKRGRKPRESIDSSRGTPTARGRGKAVPKKRGRPSKASEGSRSAAQSEIGDTGEISVPASDEAAVPVEEDIVMV